MTLRALLQNSGLRLEGASKLSAGFLKTGLPGTLPRVFYSGGLHCIGLRVMLMFLIKDHAFRIAVQEKYLNVPQYAKDSFSISTSTIHRKPRKLMLGLLLFTREKMKT